MSVGVVLPSFWNYFHDKKKLFSRTQYEMREAVEGDKEAKVSDERDKVVQEMALFLKKDLSLPSRYYIK